MADQFVQWDPDNVVIVYGEAGARLAEEVAGIMGLPSTSCQTVRRMDGESQLRVGCNVRGRDVFVEAGLVDEEWSSGRVCEPCLARLEARLDEFEDTPCPTPRAE